MDVGGVEEEEEEERPTLLFPNPNKNDPIIPNNTLSLSSSSPLSPSPPSLSPPFPILTNGNTNILKYNPITNSLPLLPLPPSFSPSLSPSLPHTPSAPFTIQLTTALKIRGYLARVSLLWQRWPNLNNRSLNICNVPLQGLGPVGEGRGKGEGNKYMEIIQKCMYLSLYL